MKKYIFITIIVMFIIASCGRNNNYVENSAEAISDITINELGEFDESIKSSIVENLAEAISDIITINESEEYDESITSTILENDLINDIVYLHENNIPILSSSIIENFIENWENLYSDFIYYLENNENDEYFHRINWFITTQTDFVIFMLGYSEEALRNTIISVQTQFNEILNKQVPEAIELIYARNNIQNGHKVYFTLLFGAIVVGIEKRALFEENNPNNTMQIEPILRNTRAYFPIFNQNDLKLIREYLNRLPREINIYFYNIY